MEPSSYKVLITTSGTGSRLGDLTTFTNKALVPLGDKAAISHIIDKYPLDARFVVTLGHFGEFVRQYLQMAHPTRNFEFVEVIPFDGPGSSLAYSLSCARKLIDCPFIYHASDSLIVDESIPPPTVNWIGGKKDFGTSSNYASIECEGKFVLRLNDKGAVDFDFLHIGLVGIQDHERFWSALDSLMINNIGDPKLGDLHVLMIMLSRGEVFEVKQFDSWQDFGNSDSYLKAKNVFENKYRTLQKNEEAIYFIDDKVIKFSYQEERCKNIVERASLLNDLVPKIDKFSNNFYSYEFVQGETLSRSTRTSDVIDLLNWSKEKLWKPTNSLSSNDSEKVLREFYIEKTTSRINKFHQLNGRVEINFINECEVPGALDLVDMVKTIVIENFTSTKFHGDLILDNILKVGPGKFVLIDWRDSFAGSLIEGDVYYDLAKLNHSFHVNHDIVIRDDFFMDYGDENVNVGILYKDNLIRMRDAFRLWSEKNGFNQRKIEILTGLVWLNMAPLHHYPFNHFLYLYGRYHLWINLLSEY